MEGIISKDNVNYLRKGKDIGVKYDKNKLRYDLFPPKSFEGITKVLTYGANKYSDNNWMHVESERYMAACFRHIQAYRKGEEFDKESDIHHLFHAISCLIFIKELENIS